MMMHVPMSHAATLHLERALQEATSRVDQVGAGPVGWYALVFMQELSAQLGVGVKWDLGANVKMDAEQILSPDCKCVGGRCIETC